MGVGSAPGNLDFVAYQGDSFHRKISLEAPSGTPVDLTGMNVEFSLAAARGGAPSFTYLSPEFIEMPIPTSGEFEIRIPSNETGKWDAGRMYYELTIFDGLGYAETYLTGVFRITREVVR